VLLIFFGSKSSRFVDERCPMKKDSEIKDHVRAEYGQAARQAKSGKPSCCGTGSLLEGDALDPITGNLYGADETHGLPAEAIRASFGCGNPTALATIQPGETVLDLGSGGGIDVFLSARRVGSTGKVYGLDMTDEMLALARENQQKAGVTNVEFLKGDIEQIPLPDNSVDLIISNCVINLSPDKDRVLNEAFRVLKPGGRLAVSDIVIRGAMPEEIRHSVELWAGCVAGALEESVYLMKLQQAGFEQISIEPTRIYTAEDAKEFLMGAGLNVETVANESDGKFMSGFVRAVKPGQTKSCCAPNCCA
jgi:arsenite methyltransferase